LHIREKCNSKVEQTQQKHKIMRHRRKWQAATAAAAAAAAVLIAAMSHEQCPRFTAFAAAR